MSVLINLISKDPKFSVEKIEEENPNLNDAFGFLSWRKDLWGNDVIKNIGCSMLHNLASNDIYAYDRKIFELKIELQKVLENLDLIENVTGIEKLAIKERILNGLSAIEVAEKNIDKIGVVIW